MHARPPSPAQRAFALKSMLSSLELLPTLLAFARLSFYPLSLSKHPVIHPSIQASIHLHIHLPTYVCIYLCNLSISNLSISLFRPSIHPIHQFTYLRTYIYIYISFYRSIYLSMYLAPYGHLDQSTYPTVDVKFVLCTIPPIYESTHGYDTKSSIMVKYGLGTIFGYILRTA